MSTLLRRSLPEDWRDTTCPDCGGELKFGEMIFSSRSLEGWDADAGLVISQDYEDSEEGSEDEHLYCTRCIAEWCLPASYDFS